ncbi:precorrin-3B synthase [Nonomuraea sp. SYSU D8015]|uniref:precorrin-3B synthase n=1 Tax=Nonomuraea sp. SYSU D8015 TaxID=2593644 RepID=UPI001CB6F250|nr:precorrin-3B synthase [Nonomuraea sp. SYSU D8015]
MPIADISGPAGRQRADACPGALQVHEAADGPLARVRLPGGAISTGQLRELASCAANLGSGVIELTSRANVQVRGLRSPTAFAGRIAAAGLLPSAAHERVRNIVASPLGGRAGGLLDTQPVVEALDLALCARPRLAELPGRFLFAVDDGTGDMLGLGADVAYVPVAAGGRLLLAGRDAGPAIPVGSAVAQMIAAAEAFLDERERGLADRDRTAWRIAELEDGPARIAARLCVPEAGPAVPQRQEERAAPVQRAGRVEQRDGHVALEAVVPLGRLSAAQAHAIADAAGAREAVPVRFTPWRTVVLLDLTPTAADRAARMLADAGLVTDPGSPWVGVSACTGRPGCAKSLADVQEDARRWVAALDGPPATPVHWAGCERRCGLPRGRVVQMVATATGYEERRQ